MLNWTWNSVVLPGPTVKLVPSGNEIEVPGTCEIAL